MARNRKSWGGNEWSKKSSSEFSIPSDQSGCEKQNPVNKLYTDEHGQTPPLQGETYTPERSANSDKAFNYQRGLEDYNPFDYRLGGAGEDSRGTKFDKTLAQEPTPMHQLKLPPIKTANFLDRFANSHCLTKHEGRKWVYSPESLSHYYSLWKRYQKALSLQPQAVVVDELGESVYRFMSGNSRYGYWDVKIGTETEGAASISAPEAIFSLCDPIITINAVIEPTTQSATWVQQSGELIPFLVTNNGRTLQLFRSSQRGPFVFVGTIAGVNPLSVIVTITTAPEEKPNSIIPHRLRFLDNQVSNFVKRVEVVTSCNGYLKLQNVTNIEFDPPPRDAGYVTSYVLQSLISDVWTTVDTNTTPSLREFDAITGDQLYRIITNFDLNSRLYSSTSQKFSFPGNTLDLYVSECGSLFGNNGAVSGTQRFTAQIKREEEPEMILFGNQGTGAYIRFDAALKRVEEPEMILYGNQGSGSYIRTDFSGTIIG